MNDATLVDTQAPAASGDSVHKKAEERSTLQYWLANEDVYTSAYVRKWLERTPAEEANDILASIAEYAKPESRSLFRMFFLGLISTLTTAEIISENSPAGRKAGIRAALQLADRNDLRAIPPLQRVFEPHWFWQGKYQEAIEVALLHLLAKTPSDQDLTAVRADLFFLAEQIWYFGVGKDPSSRRADLLIAILNRMDPPRGPEKSFLKTVATTETRIPQRTRVIETAMALYKRAHTND